MHLWKWSLAVVGCISLGSSLLAGCAPSSEKGGGSDISGGGNAVVCIKPNPALLHVYRDEATGLFDARMAEAVIEHHPSEIESIEMVDLFEARLPRGWEPGGPEPLVEAREGETHDQLLARIVERLGYQVPALSRAIERSRKQLANGSFTRVTEAMEQIRDHSPVGAIDLKRCFIATMAAHRIGPDRIDLRVDARLFDHPAHSVESKATLLLHELVYAAARRIGHDTSRRTRALVGLILSRNPQRRVRDLIRLARRLELQFEPELRTALREIAEPTIRELVAARKNSPAAPREQLEALAVRSFTPRLGELRMFTPETRANWMREYFIRRMIPDLLSGEHDRFLPGTIDVDRVTLLIAKNLESGAGDLSLAQDYPIAVEAPSHQGEEEEGHR